MVLGTNRRNNMFFSQKELSGMSILQHISHISLSVIIVK